MEPKQVIRPKQYTHIDYTALLIYVMKNHISMEQAMIDNGLSEIAKSTITRNLQKIEKEAIEGQEEYEIIELYKNKYLANLQKSIMPEEIAQAIEDLPNKKVVKKGELEDLYKKLFIMNQILQACDGNIEKAVQAINTGSTPLGAVTISYQGFVKNMKRYKEVKNQIEKNDNNRGLEERE